LRILYHIPYHGQKSDIISYPITRLKKDRILYPISLPSKISQNYPLFKERIFFGKVTKELFRILSIYTRLYSKVWPMLSIFDSNKQKISVVFDRWGAVL
jgi:hypothetical protein